MKGPQQKKIKQKEKKKGWEICDSNIYIYIVQQKIT